MGDDTPQTETPRERRHERTRDAIIDMARRLIVEKGIERLSLREIARRIDYSPAGLYEYFGSKDEIIGAVCHEANERMIRSFATIDVNMPLHDYLLELGLAYIGFARQYPEDFTLMFSRLDNGMERPPLVHEVADGDSFYFLYHAIQRGVTSGQISVDDTFDTMGVTYTLWAVVHGMATLQATYLNTMSYDFEAVDRRALSAVLNGLILK